MRLKRRHKRLIGVFIAVLIIMGAIRHYFVLRDSDLAPQEYTEKLNAVYRYSYDGDTAVFRLEDGEEVECRFLCVDSPEKDTEGYDEARAYTDKILSAAYRIVLELDPRSEKYDHYERLLAWVWADGQLVQAKLIENGHAIVRYDYEDYLYLDYLYDLQN